MKASRICGSCFVILLAVTGCTVQGKWSLTSVDPTAARRDFPYESLTLEKDGSFYAETKEPVSKTTSGVYRYEDGVLNFKEHAGVEHTYQAKFDGADRLKLSRAWQDRKLVATLARQPQ